MSLTLLLFVGLLVVGVSQQSPLHPAATALFLKTDLEGIECRSKEDAESVLVAAQPSRTANFSLLGHTDCFRPVFEKDERDPWADLVLEAAQQNAREITPRLGRTDTSLSIEVRGEADPETRAKVAAIYRAEIMSASGGRRLVHGESKDSETLVVDLLRVDVPELIVRARIREATSGRVKPNTQQGGPVWRDI